MDRDKKGRVVLCDVHGRTVMEGADIQIIAVGKPKGKTYFKWWLHRPGLAPSKELVTFTKYNNRRGHKEGWFDRYKEKLIEEWYTREDFMEDFAELLHWLRQGKVVAIACYCAPQKRSQCHLSILADIIRDWEYEVTEAEPIKYR